MRALDTPTMQAMIIVEGDEGRGSGFVVKMSGKTYLITNSHVVRGNHNVKFRNLQNVELATGPLEIAEKADAVRASVIGVSDALELEPQLDKVKIGDEVIVAGNSEGEGVVREIPGKVVGIGPDRLEVDAPFVPGNSGSPILLKSTGRIIGVATYMKFPDARKSGKSPFSLNEVRRFGYRLDTVAKWIRPKAKDRLMEEGTKLAEMESLFTSVTAIVDSNAPFVMKWGASSFVSKHRAQQYPTFATLSRTIDEFTAEYSAANGVEARNKSAANFFGKIKGMLSEESRGLSEKQFSGYYAVQLKEVLGRYKEFSDWYDGTSTAAYREAWLNAESFAARRFTIPPIDPEKFKFVLSDRRADDEPADHCHHVTYPPDSQPANLEGLYWTIVEPGGSRRSYQISRSSLWVRTPADGNYQVFIEFRIGEKPKVVSNVIEFKYGNGEPAKPSTEVPVTSPAPSGNK
ncbi:MAG: trypsin-like peptidase domain-containing protein [Chthoniobacter sp.]